MAISREKMTEARTRANSAAESLWLQGFLAIAALTASGFAWHSLSTLSPLGLHHSPTLPTSGASSEPFKSLNDRITDLARSDAEHLQRNSRELFWGTIVFAVLGVTKLLSAFRAIREQRRFARLSTGSCGRCGYCLEGLDSPRCPECGDPNEFLADETTTYRRR